MVRESLGDEESKEDDDPEAVGLSPCCCCCCCCCRDVGDLEEPILQLSDAGVWPLPPTMILAQDDDDGSNRDSWGQKPTVGATCRDAGPSPHFLPRPTGDVLALPHLPYVSTQDTIQIAAATNVLLHRQHGEPQDPISIHTN